MKINYNTKIVGQKCILVPYRKEHVERYHQWMLSEELRTEATASELLTLEEEHQNQQSWYLDEKKCTFIILDGDTNDMAGDVNLFFNDDEDEHAAELDIMIAEPKSRGKGIGKEATLLILAYGVRKLKVTRYIVKIGDGNSVSLSMFKKLGFQEISHSSAFQETTLELPITSAVSEWLAAETQHAREEAYDECTQKPLD